MRVLVTGATGLIGRYVAAECLERGAEVYAVTSRKAPPADGPAGVVWRMADLIAPTEAASLIEDISPSHVIHCAWDTRQPVYWSSPENLAWVSATTAMAAAFAKSGGKRFVLVGTCAEYDWSYGEMIEDQTPERPTTVYGMSKLAAHHAVHAAARLGFSAVTARIFFSYGPHENASRFIPYLCQTLARGEIPRLSGGRQLRDLVHGRDAAGALVALAYDDTLAGAVNIGSGAPVALGHVAQTLAAIAGRPGDVGLGVLPDRPDDPEALLPSVDKLFSIGWRPEINLLDGLEDTYAYWARRVRLTS